MPDSKSSSLYSIKLEATQTAEERILHQAQADPVLFALYHLKFVPDPWQAQFLRSRAQRIILNCSRQSGKSTITAILALWEAIHSPRSTIVLDSPSLRQSQELMLKFSEFLAMVDRSVKLDSDTKLSVRFANGSRVLTLPGSEKTIRGISAVTLLILNEAAGIPDELYGAVRPMLAVSRGRLVLMSTPRGAWVAQEYECQFIAAGATRIQRSWLRYEDRPPAGLNIALGIDLAISEKETADYTAGAVLGRDLAGNLHVLDVQRIQGSFSQQIEFIRQLASKWRPAVVGIEDVAYQKALIQQLAAQTSLNVRGIKPISDKVSRFAPLEARYELGQVYHVRGLPQEFEAELLSFPIGAHDDMVDSLAYAWQALGQIPQETRLVFSGATKKPAWT